MTTSNQRRNKIEIKINNKKQKKNGTMKMRKKKNNNNNIQRPPVQMDNSQYQLIPKLGTVEQSRMRSQAGVYACVCVCVLYASVLYVFVFLDCSFTFLLEQISSLL